MTNQIDILTVRINGKVKAYEGINDYYTVIQLNVYKEWLSEAEMQHLRDLRWYECDTHFSSEQEAMDLYVDFGNLKISIERVKIELI